MEGTGPTVIVVEDDELVRSFFCRALERGGYTPVPAANGGDALNELRHTEDVAALLIDGLLPDMHGADLARTLLDEPMAKSTGICFVSGAVHAESLMDAGMAALAKPVRSNALLETISKLNYWHCCGGCGSEQRTVALEKLVHDFSIAP